MEKFMTWLSQNEAGLIAFVVVAVVLGLLALGAKRSLSFDWLYYPLTVLATICALVVGIFFGGTIFGAWGTSAKGKQYTVEYSVDGNLQTITVKNGEQYQIETIPEKFGYEFTGLFDSEKGGKQYIDQNGKSTTAYSDDCNKVLYVRYEPKDYTVILDYQGAAVTGERSFVVKYDSKFPQLPLDLTIAYHDFIGWFTEVDGGEVQVADQYGALPAKDVLNVENFDFSKNSITLYAQFELKKYDVTFSFGNGMPVEIVQVVHGTNIKDVVPKTRVDGNAVLSWSTQENDSDGSSIFSGNITAEKTLYAVEFAPVIDFAVNGGKEVKSIVARAGTAITLPIAERDCYEFVEWQDDKSKAYTSTVMPEESIVLSAVWRAKVVFDENGGSQVDDISVSTGESIALPTPEREGYIFAGWYTEGKTKYESTKMPAEGILLKAGWYEVKTKRIIIITAENRANSGELEEGESNGPMASWRTEVDLSKYISQDNTLIEISLNVKIKNDQSPTIAQAGLYFYNDTILSSSTLQGKFVETISSNKYVNYTYQGEIQLKTKSFYICYYAKITKDGGGYHWKMVYFSDMWADITYPDTSEIIL